MNVPLHDTLTAMRGLTFSCFPYLLVVAAAFLQGLALVLNCWHGVPAGNDFVMFHAAARSLLGGGSIYQPFLYVPYMHEAWLTGTAPGTGIVPLNLNPPIMSLLFLPLGLLPLRVAYMVSYIVQLLAALWVLRQLVRTMLPSSHSAFAWSACSLLVYFPTFANLYAGQVGLALMAVLGLATLALLKGHHRTAGIWLGLALTAKLFVGLIFVWLLWNRRWSSLTMGLMVWAMCMTVGFLLFGVGDHLHWISAMQENAQRALSWNGSLWALLARNFPADQTGLGLVLALGIGLPVLAVLARQEPRFALAGLFPLMLLLSPLGWIYYFPVLIISALLLWPYQKGLLVAALALSACPVPLMLPAGITVATVYPFGLLFMVVAACYAGRSSSAQTGT